jgi:hypothetical protein
MILDTVHRSGALLRPGPLGLRSPPTLCACPTNRVACRAFAYLFRETSDERDVDNSIFASLLVRLSHVQCIHSLQVAWERCL